jgi:hypothetical protein
MLGLHTSRDKKAREKKEKEKIGPSVLGSIANLKSSGGRS